MPVIQRKSVLQYFKRGNIMINLLIYPISIIPTILIYFWVKKKVMVDEEHRLLCKQALINGFKVVLPVILLSGSLALLGRLIFGREESLLQAFYHNFFVLALAEEIAKTYMLYDLFKKHPNGYSWLDITIYKVIVAMGFSLLESALYAIATNPIQIIVRGISFPHLGYGLIVGYFLGKGIKENKKIYPVLGFLLSWFLHGLYDFSLAPVVLDTFDFIPLVAISIAVLCLILAIVFVVFVNKAKKQEKYTVIIK